MFQWIGLEKNTIFLCNPARCHTISLNGCNPVCVPTCGLMARVFGYVARPWLASVAAWRTPSHSYARNAHTQPKYVLNLDYCPCHSTHLKQLLKDEDARTQFRDQRALEWKTKFSVLECLERSGDASPCSQSQ